MGQIRNMININNHDELNTFPSPKFNTKLLITRLRLMKWPFLIEFCVPDGKFDASTILMGLMILLEGQWEDFEHSTVMAYCLYQVYSLYK
jgi:hypothetical protein